MKRGIYIGAHFSLDEVLGLILRQDEYAFKVTMWACQEIDRIITEVLQFHYTNCVRNGIADLSEREVLGE